MSVGFRSAILAEVHAYSCIYGIKGVPVSSAAVETAWLPQTARCEAERTVSGVMQLPPHTTDRPTISPPSGYQHTVAGEAGQLTAHLGIPARCLRSSRFHLRAKTNSSCKALIITCGLAPVA